MESTKTQESLAVKQRTPIVTVLGHVDHGKTTLLDKIRNTNVASREAGGITQGIGASVIKAKGGDITFIDTPGHAAFSNMRSRGAAIADIAILVVSATDGVMPQTKEALEYILAAKIPFIVAATKMDLQSADIELVRSGLEKEGILLEGKGGDIPVVGVSAKTGEGIAALLEMIQLVFEMNEVKSDENSILEAYVFESGKDKRGAFASVVVKNGKISVGDDVVTEDEELKIRGIFDENNKSVSVVMPGYPGLIIGFSKVPKAGTPVWKRSEKGVEVVKKEVHAVVEKVSDDEIAVIIKAQNDGALEAVIANLPEKVVVVGRSVGDVNDSDVFLAKSMNADIYCFESKVPVPSRKLAEMEGVKIYSYGIIYELFESLEERLKKGLVVEAGRAEIVAVFPFNNKKIAGSKVISGKIAKGDSLILKRGDREVGKVKAISLKKNKVDVAEVGQGEEFGVIFIPQLDFTIGDAIISLQK